MYDYRRSVEIDVDTGEGQAFNLGSGYRISENLVLSCAHIFEPKDNDFHRSIRVRDITGVGIGHVHYCWHSDELDLSLWAVETPPRPTSRSLDPVRIAALPLDVEDVVEFSMYGWPRLAAIEKNNVVATRMGFESSGEVKLSEWHSAAHKTGRIPLHPSELPQGADQSWWAGMSGAAVFSGSYLVGVQVSEVNPQAGLIVEAKPVAQMLSDSSATGYLIAAGVSVTPHELPLWRDVQPSELSTPPLRRRSIGTRSFVLEEGAPLAEKDMRSIRMLAEGVKVLVGDEDDDESH